MCESGGECANSNKNYRHSNYSHIRMAGVLSYQSRVAHQAQGTLLKKRIEKGVEEIKEIGKDTQRLKEKGDY